MNPSSVFFSLESKAAVLAYYDKMLEKAAGTYERLAVETRFGSTFILATGDKNAPPMVLLHGSSMNSIMWAKDMQVYSQRFRVYAPELPGEPGRSVELPLPFHTFEYVDWLVDVFDALALEKAVVVGASLGGWVALRFAAQYPARANKLILLCPPGIGSQNHAFKDIAMALLSKGEQGVDELFQKINGDAPIPEVMLNYQKLIASSFHSRQEPIPLLSDRELRSLSMPSALFFGEKDIMLNAQEAVERYKRVVPGAKALLLPGKGHSLTGLTDEIMAFLETPTP